MEELLCFQYMENTKAPNNKSPKRCDFCVLSLLLLLCFMLTLNFSSVITSHVRKALSDQVSNMTDIKLLKRPQGSRSSNVKKYFSC